MTEPLRIGVIELKLREGGSLILRAADIDRVIAKRERDPEVIARLQNEYPPRDYGQVPNPEFHRRVRDVPYVDKCTVVLKNGIMYEVKTSKDDLHAILRDS